MYYIVRRVTVRHGQEGMFIGYKHLSPPPLGHIYVGNLYIYTFQISTPLCYHVVHIGSILRLLVPFMAIVMARE